MLMLCCWHLSWFCGCAGRLWYVIEPEQGDLFLIAPPSPDNSGACAGQDSNADTINGSDCLESLVREGLPAWLGADIPVIPAGCSAAEGALSRAQGAQLLQLCCSIKVRSALGAATAELACNGKSSKLCQEAAAFGDTLAKQETHWCIAENPQPWMHTAHLA